MLCDKVVCAFACSSVRTSSTKCHREQTAGPRSTNFRARMQVNKVSSYSNFQRNHKRPSSLLSRSKIRVEYIGKFGNISQTVTDRTSIAIASTYERACSLSIGIFTFDLDQF